MAAASLPHDSDRAADFLLNMHEGRRVNLVALREGMATEARSFDRTELGALTAWISARQSQYNIYFHVNDIDPSRRNVKAKKEDIVLVRWLHVDIDDLGALERLSNFRPKPTIITMSGGGYQAFWKLSEAITDVALAEAYNMSLSELLGGDNCHNADRIMRVPYTVNVPNSKKRRNGRLPVLAVLVEADYDRIEPLSSFPLDQTKNISARNAALIEESSVRLIEFNDISEKVPEELIALMKDGDDLHHPIGSKNARFPSRSEAVFYAACSLVRIGCTDAVIAGVLINPNYRISESVLEKRRPIAYAIKQAQSARLACSGRWPDVGPKGNPRSTYRNALVALRRLGLSFSYDLFRERRIVSGAIVEEHAGEVSDDVCVILRNLIDQHFDFDPRPENVAEAVKLLCLENAFHPIRSMLNALAWDGEPRIDRWLHAYLGAADTSLISAIGRILLLAMVRRVRQPGVKFDQIVVLEGPQGSGKSTSLQILAGIENHSDQEILTQGAKVQMELLAGVWVYELGEVEGMNRTEVNKIKAFASRQVEKSRKAYGRFPTSQPRQAVLVGTTNDDKYLRDQTGNRRFWPVKTGSIDLVALANDRDQLLAEAAVREARGESIELPRELWDAAAAEQSARLEEDPWIEQLADVKGDAFGEVVRVSTARLLRTVLEVPVDRQNQGHTKRLAAAMTKLGWTAAKFREGAKAGVRGYERPKEPSHVDDTPPAKQTF